MESGMNGWSVGDIIGLLIIAGIFSNGGFGFGGAGYANAMTNEFVYTNLANDVRANGTAITTVDRDVLENKFALDRDILENRYQNSLQTNTLQAGMNSCCCELKTLIREDGEKTRSLITQNRIADLEKELVQAQGIIANTAQTQNILNSLGNYYPKIGVNPYTVYGYPYGTTIQ